MVGLPRALLGRAPPPDGVPAGAGGWPNWQPPPANELSTTPDQQSLWKPAILSALLLVGFFFGYVYFGFAPSEVEEILSLLCGIGLAVVPIVGIVMCFPTRTRRWGQGVLLGIPLAIGGGLVIGAGLCVALLAGGDL